MLKLLGEVIIDKDLSISHFFPRYHELNLRMKKQTIILVRLIPGIRVDYSYSASRIRAIVPNKEDIFLGLGLGLGLGNKEDIFLIWHIGPQTKRMMDGISRLIRTFPIII